MIIIFNKAYIDPRAKEKPLSLQLEVTFLPFHATLMQTTPWRVENFGEKVSNI